jgi:hypothetical protein
MAKPKTRPEGTPTAQAKGGQGASGYAELYKKYLPIAMQIPAEQVQPCRAAVRIVLVNVKRGVASVCGTPEQQKLVREHLPKVPLERILALPDIARALLFASWRAMPQASDKQISKAIQEISGPREQLLTLAELLAKRGKLDPAAVATIRAGSGKYDMAEDGVALATMFLERAKELKGLHPFTEEELKALCQRSEWLLENLTPAGARTEPKKREPSPSEDDKNRLWTLVVQDHPWVLKIGYYHHGDDFESYTPRLQARVASVANAEEPDEEEEEEAEEEEGSGGEEPSGAPEGGAPPG